MSTFFLSRKKKHAQKNFGHNDSINKVSLGRKEGCASHIGVNIFISMFMTEKYNWFLTLGNDGIYVTQH